MLAVGDIIKFPMWRLSNGCLFPYNEGEKPNNGAVLEMIDGEVTEGDTDIISVKYFCNRCNRYFETSVWFSKI